MILHTSVIGKGEPIVFLHSGLQTGESDFNYQYDYFRKNYKVILPDLRGHGKSKVDQIDIVNFFEDSAVDLKDTLDFLQIEKTHIVGGSLGALAGLVFTKRFPDRVSSLVLSGVISEKPHNWAELQLIETSMQKAVFENVEAVHYFNQLHLSDWQRFIGLSQEQDWYPFTETSDVTGIRCPALLIVGEGKAHEVSGALNYREMNDRFHMAVVPFAAHLVHNEQPEIYTAILENFLSNIAK